MIAGFFQLFMGIMCFIYLIASVRTNVCFFFIFFTLVMAFGMLTTAYWQLAEGNAALATKFITVSQTLRNDGADERYILVLTMYFLLAFRLVVPSDLSPACSAGGSSSPSSWRLWISPSRCRWVISRSMSRGSRSAWLLGARRRYDFVTRMGNGATPLCCLGAGELSQGIITMGSKLCKKRR